MSESDLCCQALGIIGDWDIYVKVPVLVPSKIKFNWNDGTGWQEINGTDYLIQQSGGIGYGDLVLVAYTYTIKNRSRTTTINRSGYFYYPVSMIIRDEDGWINLYIVDYFEEAFIIGADPSQGGSILNYSILNVTPTGSGGGTTQYNLKIYDSSILVYNQTRTTSPTANKESKYCIYPDNWLFLSTYQNYDRGAYCQEFPNRNKNELKLISPLFIGLVGYPNLASAQSPDDCSDPPLFKVECKPYKRCPEGSCEVICGDMVCCYSEEGNLVESFPLSQLY
ncbi:hypothetical protein [Gloeothece verrucosa]|uniref:Uncharacterized protein n=1 Tax=Gloeothece verrucosa (strain PCC 7822) TaxID=497965 RepID=E0UCA7_GLOV7|nr:hypothetical protein [Gloeothece verrucosa]ADN12864.1 hypothetical protein Cyan7822_0844 [Gloeothece verrucosa PCC 7822]